MKQRFVIALIALIVGNSHFLHAQETGKSDKIEMELSISPRVNSIVVSADIIMADYTVRYKFSDRLSAGVGFSPTFMDFSDGITGFMPFHLSVRYILDAGQKVSPYLLMDVGGSFLQLEPDPAFLGRFAIGAEYRLSNRCSIFSEVGIAGMTTFSLWTPLTVGFRF